MCLYVHAKHMLTDWHEEKITWQDKTSTVYGAVPPKCVQHGSTSLENVFVV